MSSSTPATRAAKRDYWTRPSVARACRGIDWAMALMFITGVLLLGSLNL